MLERSQNGRPLRVLVTGMGAVTPLGVGVEALWAGLVAGRSGVSHLTHFDTTDFPVKIGGYIHDFTPENHFDRRDVKRMARFTQFAMVATKEAIDHAGLDLNRENPERVGVEMGNAVGDLQGIEEQYEMLRERGPRRIVPTVVPTVLINMAACQVAIQYGAKGPSGAPVAACATGIYAIGDAMRRIRRGEADVMVAGSTESILTPLAIAAFWRIQALSTRNEDPEGACRPFDKNRDGTVMGEGAAVVILEREDHALARGAQIYGEVVGYGVSEDAYHLIAPDPQGDGAARAMRLALEEAGVTPSKVDWISAHGTATPLNDLSETMAIKRVFGESAYGVPVSSIKSMIGHTLGAAGSVSVVANLKAIQTGLIPPTINLESPDSQCDLDFVPGQARRATVDVAMSNAFGFGGQNASLVVRRYQP
ncbi:MAG: beta-ketoacyl-ACP synthase II [Ardenticatenaceae bacterium]|nr:beta-ketoacyl-ACP synthase II [Ardenticatenaceae bacterium]HBY98177.1 beta-ketoacyl-[acyl-carrier-protein] synthase II [Chloroflexota bacterium]